jgi:pimeloyl-ACP methyl ester carboxylesterase
VTAVPPQWFTDAVNRRPEHRFAEVHGCRLHYRSWGVHGAPPLILLHGGGAHSAWWDHIAPELVHGHHVIAPDLSGHGDSGRRESYTLATWAGEVLALSQAVAPGHRPTIVGHSLGGWIASTVAMRFGRAVSGVVVIDSPLRNGAPEERPLRTRGNPAGCRSRDEIVGRFRPVPEQDEVLPYVAHHVASQSVVKRNGAWFWKFDPEVFARRHSGDMPAEEEELEHVLDVISCRIAYFRCARGLVPDEMADRIRHILQLRGPFIEIANAGHHPMLDQPQALVASIRTLVELWSIS